MEFKEKVLQIQTQLKAPKDLRNSFGGYNYRSCESILENVKPLLSKYGLLLNIADDVVTAGERIYVKAIATLIDTETDKSITTYGWAREPEEKKGMDSSQVTGATSSYARKYALNAMFLIDDTKDADTDEYRKEADARQERQEKQKVQRKKAEPKTEVRTEPKIEDHKSEQIGFLEDIRKGLAEEGIPEKWLSDAYDKNSLDELSLGQQITILKKFDQVVEHYRKQEVKNEQSN